MAKKQIQMIASIAGDAVAYAPDQILTIGEDIDEATATAFCLFPPEEPRARALGWDPAGPKAETREQPAMEQETAPAAETRETAVQPRGRRRVKPPVETPEPETPEPEAA